MPAWPSSNDYFEAVQAPGAFFADPDLKAAEAVCGPMGMPVAFAGNFADVYQLRSADGSKSWAVKCFTRQMAGLRERYREISTHLHGARLKATVEFKYLEQGVRIGGEWFPVLKMDWVSGFTLRQFVEENLRKPKVLSNLFDIWLKVEPMLRKVNIAHGDLQHGNVMLVPREGSESFTLRLIDYDGLWVPKLANNPPDEAGHPSYQHPLRRKQNLYTPEIDRFPHLVIACALRCLGRPEGRDLWKSFDSGENLLFARADFETPARSKLLKDLWETNDPELQTWVGHIVTAGTKPLQATQPLQQLMTDGQLVELKPQDRDLVQQLFTRGGTGVLSPSLGTPSSVDEGAELLNLELQIERLREKLKAEENEFVLSLDGPDDEVERLREELKELQERYGALKARAKLPQVSAASGDLLADLIGVAPQVLELIPESVIREELILPVRAAADGSLVVAMRDAQAFDLVQKLMFILNREITPLPAPRAMLLQAIEHHFGPGADPAQSLPKDALLFFTAEWSGPCRQLAPVLAKLEKEGLPVRTLDADQHPELMERFDVKAIPTFLVLLNGQPAQRIVGSKTEVQLRAILKESRLAKPIKPTEPAVPPAIDLTKVPASVVDIVPEKFARENTVFPIRVEPDGKWVFAVTNATDSTLRDKLQKITRSFTLVTLPAEQIKDAIEKYFARPSPESVLQNGVLFCSSGNTASFGLDKLMEQTVEHMLIGFHRLPARTIDCEKRKDLARRFGITDKSMFLLVIDGQVKLRKPPPVPLEELVKWAQQASAASATPGEKAAALAIDLTKVPASVVALVPDTVARENQVFPIRVEANGTLVLAVPDARNQGLYDKLRFIFNKEVTLVTVPVNQIAAAIARHYGGVVKKDEAATPRNAVLFFTAKWAGPCRALEPIVAKLQKEGLSIQSIDTDDRADLAKQFGVQTVPTFALVIEGAVTTRKTGALTEDDLRQWARKIARSSLGELKPAEASKTPEPPKAAIPAKAKAPQLLRNLGPHPVTGKVVNAGIGRSGPFVVHAGVYKSLGKDDDVMTIDLDRAVELLTPGLRRMKLRTLGHRAAWGIDIGDATLKAVCLQSDGESDQPEILAFDYIEYPKLLTQPDADPVELVDQALETLLGRNDFSKVDLCVGAPGLRGVTRFLKLPPVEEKKIGDVVKFEARQQIPFSLDEVYWDYQQLSSSAEEDGFILDAEVVLVAVKRETVTKLLAPFVERNLEVAAVQLGPLALLNAMLNEKVAGSNDADQYEALLDIGTESSALVITNGQTFWHRSIPIGGSHFTKALTKEFQLTFAKAEHLKRNAAKSPDLANVLKALRPVLNDFVNETQRSLGFFSSMNRNAKVTKVHALGNTFKLPGLQKYLAQHLAIEVEKPTAFRQIQGPIILQTPVFAENLLTFGTAYGLALQPLEMSTLTVSLAPPKVGWLERAKRSWFGSKQ